MSEKSIDQRFREAVERLRTEGVGGGDVEAEYFGVLEERSRGREGAVEAAVAKEDVELSAIERKALDREVSAFMDRIDQVDDFIEPIPEAAKLALLRSYVEELVAGAVGEETGTRRPGLRFKSVVAFELEYAAHDDDNPDGILGRALDQVIDQLAPYVARKPGWQ